MRGSLQPFMFSLLLSGAIAWLWPETIIYVILSIWLCLVLFIGWFLSTNFGWLLSLLIPLIVVVIFCLGEINMRL